MASIPTKALVAAQRARLMELETFSRQLRERAPGSFSTYIVHARLDALNSLWREAHIEIMSREDYEVDLYLSEVYSRLQESNYATQDLLLDLLSKLETANEGARSDETVDVSCNQDNFEPIATKLPKIELPKFSGEYENWAEFYDRFTNLVHNAPRLAESTKLHYLKTCLTGKAAELVRDVAVTDANYISTWESLKAKFYKPWIIITNHLKALIDLPHLRKESAEELNSLTNEAQRLFRALKTLEIEGKQMDMWFVFHISERLDPYSKKAWQARINERERKQVGEGNSRSPGEFIPRFEDLAQFLEDRAHALHVSKADGGWTTTKTQLYSAVRGAHHVRTKFTGKSPHERWEDVRRLRLCYNCFGLHPQAKCDSPRRCLTCKRKHHTLIHLDLLPRPYLQPNDTDRTNPGANSKTTSDGVNVCTTTIQQQATESVPVILATAKLFLIGPHGQRTIVRALLDQGAETSFVSETISCLLELPRFRADVSVTGVGGAKTCIARCSTHFTLQSAVDPNYHLEVDAYILPRLTSQLPSQDVSNIPLDRAQQLPLADPLFYKSNSIDVLLGAEIYAKIIRAGVRHMPPSSLVAQRTALGWIISGSGFVSRARRAVESPTSPLRALHSTTEDSLNDLLQRFWMLEETPTSKRPVNPEDVYCENLFMKSHERETNGRYIVYLPQRSEPPAAGEETRRLTVNMLRHIHHKFNRDTKLASAYQEIMAAYLRLGHMEQIPASQVYDPQAWYLPHHAVVQNGVDNYKLRVVFNASQPTRDTRCLNDYLLPGPTLHNDLALILLNWRRYRFAFTADVVKMFRQIGIARKHQDYQRIVWSPRLGEPPVDYRLTTVTYGTTCAPYLAIRTLLQLVKDEGRHYPLGARCLENNTYVDDIFAGADDLAVATQTKRELVSLLDRAGFTLGKWAANHASLNPPEQLDRDSCEAKVIDQDQSIKTLGIQWHYLDDAFRFTTTDFNLHPELWTKRALVSRVARLFDPLGWLAPLTLHAKIMIQDLWLLKIGWDDPLPSDIRERWASYCSSLSTLPVLSIGRWFGASTNAASQIHSFSDASARAYAAAVYLRISDGAGQVQVCLLAAKTKVAPVKTRSIPNLELCAASLLTQLILYVQRLDFVQNLPVFAWSDSQIVLTWLQKHACHWKTFVANRVSSIQTELPYASWAHVPSRDNPADLATRGCTPIEIINADLWWHGPEWLVESTEHWPQCPAPRQILHNQITPKEPSILTQYSTLTKLVRVIAWCLRPIDRLRNRSAPSAATSTFLTAQELRRAHLTAIRLAHQEAFAKEIETLKAGRNLARRDPLHKLNPFVSNNDDVLRVGGRLSNSTLEWERKHPPILPRRSHLSRLLVRQAHIACLHGGPTLTLAVLLQRAWVLGQNKLVKTEIRQCLACQRAKPRLAHQLMGDLPRPRVTASKAFSTAGLDYAGPIQVRTTKGRGHKAYKGYIVLFVCFPTRAIHLELVGDLTTASFLDAFRRFVGRRGNCNHLYSDNATNFKCADKELRAMFRAASEFYKETATLLANDLTSWTFIPPNSPHYGGLWEAGVRSVKHHLKRAIGDRTFTFEELSTILVEIEACLNSRPLCPLSSDPEDLSALTPAHLLTGSSAGLLPDRGAEEAPRTTIRRHHEMQLTRKAFWKRWSMEYLQHLQERSKWRSPTDNFTKGQLVLLRDDRYPPSKWPLGRITATFPGPDGLVRVVAVRTATGTLRRHITRLCPLHVEQESASRSP